MRRKKQQEQERQAPLEQRFESPWARPEARFATEVEVRTFGLDAVKIEERAAEDGGGMRVHGHAAVFDLLSENLGGFQEKIAKGAFAEAIAKDDVRALFNHDEDHVLGRNRSGTLALAEDDVGLKTVIDLPDTQTGRDLAALLRRGDVSQMSFAFEVRREDQDWEKVGDGPWIRTIKRIARLWDVSIVTYPAYPQTDAALRALQLRQGEGAPPVEERFASNVQKALTKMTAAMKLLQDHMSGEAKQMPDAAMKKMMGMMAAAMTMLDDEAMMGAEQNSAEPSAETAALLDEYWDVFERSAALFAEVRAAQRKMAAQTVVFSKAKSPADVNDGKGWAVGAARAWLDAHDFKSSKVDETDSSFRFRQFDPMECEVGSFRTLTENFPAGVSVVVCAKKSEAAAAPEAEERAEVNDLILTARLRLVEAGL